LKEQGFDSFVGVPCSILRDILDHLLTDREVTCILATREDEAIGIAVGAYLGRKKPVVFMQNSGLGLSINALTSLVLLYQIPILFLITWRGHRGMDAPEHHMIGKCTVKLLKDIELPVFILPRKNVKKTMSAAINIMNKDKKPIALLLQEGIIK
jgi:phosphonopyruvate decarboxylase